MRDKAYEFIAKLLRTDLTTEEHVSYKFWLNQTLLLSSCLFLLALGTGWRFQYTISTTLLLAFGMFIAPFVILFAPLCFGKFIYKKMDVKTRKLIIIILYSLALAIFILPFIMVFVFKQK
jgi:hypothetical protein